MNIDALYFDFRHHAGFGYFFKPGTEDTEYEFTGD
jgi:hypothetical protein